MHRKHVFNEDSARILEKKKLLYKCMADCGIENIGALAEQIGKTRTAIYNCINYLPYRSTTTRLGCYPTAQAIGKILGWDELDIKQWYNGNLENLV